METEEKVTCIFVHGIVGGPVHSVIGRQLEQYLLSKEIKYRIKSYDTIHGMSTAFEFESDHELLLFILLRYPEFYSKESDPDKFFKPDKSKYLNDIYNISKDNIRLFDV